MTEQHLLPPVLAMPDLRLVSVTVEKDGTVLRFATAGRSNPVREVAVLIKTAGISNYEYAIYDSRLQLINHYQGQHGDPNKDEWIGSYGLQTGRPPA